MGAAAAHDPDACRSCGRTVHPGLAPAIVRQAFVRRSFCSFAGRGRSAADDHWQTMNIHRKVGTLRLAAPLQVAILC